MDGGWLISYLSFVLYAVLSLALEDALDALRLRFRPSRASLVP